MQKKLLKQTPEAKAPASYRELSGSSYIVLQDGTVARKLKPRTLMAYDPKNDKITGPRRYWFLSHEGRLRCVSQKTIDEMTTFP